MKGEDGGRQQATAAAKMAPKASKSKAAAQAAVPVAGPSVDEAKTLIAELCGLFYDQGWVGGTGGGISVKAGDGTIVMAPSGVQKERMKEDDMFVLNAAGEVLHTPAAKPPPARPPKLSECSPLFMAVRAPCRYGLDGWDGHFHKGFMADNFEITYRPGLSIC